MSSQRIIRCTMKMRTCGLFWYKAVISLRFPSLLTPSQPQQGRLTIARPKVFGGKLEILLDHNTTSLVSVSRKQERRHQLKIRYGSRFQTLTLRAPTSAIFETWWAAFENALASPNFVVLPVIDARAHQVTISPVLPTIHNDSRPKQTTHTATLETVVEELGDESSDDIPILESGGLSSPPETDILASWRTWGSLDYFASPPSSNDSFPNRGPSSDELDDTDSSNMDDNSTSNRISVYSDISEFWSRPSEWEDEINHDDFAPTATKESKLLTLQNHTTPDPQDNEDRWLDDIALFAFRQKVGASRKSESRPSRHVAWRLHPLLSYALL